MQMQTSELRQGRRRMYCDIEFSIIDGFTKIPDIDVLGVLGLYVGLKRYIDRRESMESNEVMPWSVKTFLKTFGIGQARFYKLANVLWQVGLMDVEKEITPEGWRNVYIIHDYPPYDGPLRTYRKGTFKGNAPLPTSNGGVYPIRI